MKPYRLLNASELHELTLHFNNVLDEWNETYCVTPLNLHLTVPPKNYSTTEALLIQEQENHLGFIEGDYLSIITQALFTEEKRSFHGAGQKLMLILLDKLFKTEHSQLNALQESPDWFYAGSTSLLLTFGCKEHHFTLTLNPDWVYQQLPKNKTAATKLCSLNEAITEQTVSLNLELIPSGLSVKNLAQMQIGDILSTHHLLTEPLRITRGKQLFAQADLGQSSHYKSIVLKEAL